LDLDKREGKILTEQLKFKFYAKNFEFHVQIAYF